MARKKRTSGRLNTSLSDRGWERLRDLERFWYPGRDRVDGFIVERAIDEAWERMRAGIGWNNLPRPLTHETLADTPVELDDPDKPDAEQKTPE